MLMAIITVAMSSVGEEHPRLAVFAGAGECGSKDGVGTAARFESPACLASSFKGLLVCDGHNQRLRLIPINEKTGEAQMPQTIFSGTGSLSAVMETAGGEILVADLRLQQIQRIDKGKVIAIAGHPVSQALPVADGRGQDATFKRPAAIAADANMNVYVADSLDHAIRRITRRTNMVSTLAGSGRAGFVDGIGSEARFHKPSAIALWQQTLLVADTGNNVIRGVDVVSSAARLVAGSREGTSGWADGTASDSLFDKPSAIVVYDDMLMVLEQHARRIRTISLSALTTQTLYTLPNMHITSSSAALAYFFPPMPTAASRYVSTIRSSSSTTGRILISDSRACLIRSLDVEPACNGKALSHMVLDRCHLCGGNNVCVDCADIPHGGRARDKCGVCGGDNTSCPELDYTRVQGAQLDPALLPKPLIYMPSTYLANKGGSVASGRLQRGGGRLV